MTTRPHRITVDFTGTDTDAQAMLTEIGDVAYDIPFEHLNATVTAVSGDHHD